MRGDWKRKVKRNKISRGEVRGRVKRNGGEEMHEDKRKGGRSAKNTKRKKVGGVLEKLGFSRREIKARKSKGGKRKAKRRT